MPTYPEMTRRDVGSGVVEDTKHIDEWLMKLVPPNGPSYTFETTMRRAIRDVVWRAFLIGFARGQGVTWEAIDGQEVPTHVELTPKKEG